MIMEMPKKFQEYAFIVKNRDQNSVTDSLAIFASLFVIPKLKSAIGLPSHIISFIGRCLKMTSNLEIS